MPKFYAYVTNSHIGSIQALGAATSHARRLDRTSIARQRLGAELGGGLDWPLDLAPSPAGPGRDYVKAWHDHLGRQRAKRMGKGPLALHSIVGVSREWLAETGSVYDPENPRVQALFREAVAWANAWSDSGVIAARFDLDEVGAGAVDVFTVPLRPDRRLRGGLRAVSVNGALEELSLRHCKRKGSHFAALNTDWAAWAQRALDPRLERGTPKRQTGRLKLPPDLYKEKMRIKQAVLKLSDYEKVLNAQAQQLEDKKAILMACAEEADARELSLETIMGAVDIGMELLARDEIYVEHDQWYVPDGTFEALVPALPLLRPIVTEVTTMRLRLRKLLNQGGLAADMAKQIRDELVLG